MYSIRARLPYAGLLALIVAVLACEAMAQDAQPTYRLSDAAAAGDSYQVDSTDTFEISATIGLNGEVRTFAATQHDHDAFSDTVESVRADGLPDLVRRKYTISRRSSTSSEGSPQVIVRSRQGKTITFRRVGDRMTVTPSTGTLVAEDMKELIHEFDKDDKPSFPDPDVAVGDEWTFTLSGLGGDVGEAPVTFTAKLAEVVPYMGHRCAHVKVTAPITFSLPTQPGDVTGTLSGDLYDALDIQRMIGFSLSGPVRFAVHEGRLPPNATLSSKGSLTMAQSARYSRVAGKPTIPAVY